MTSNVSDTHDIRGNVRRTERGDAPDASARTRAVAPALDSRPVEFWPTAAIRAALE
ncbi:transcriptional regulator, partial [Mycobacterium sp. ITM-2017-0098]